MTPPPPQRGAQGEDKNKKMRASIYNDENKVNSCVEKRGLKRIRNESNSRFGLPPLSHRE